MGFLPTTKYKNNERIVSGSVNVENSDMLLNIDTSLVACTINLQSIPNDYWNTLYKLYVKDISNNAGTNNITIVAPNGYKINNSQNLILNTNGESVLVRISSNTDYVCVPNKPGHIIQDEGVTLPQQPILDFVGSGVTVTDGVGKTIVTIPQGITQAYTTVQDEGSSLPQRNIIDFVGTGVIASDNGSKTIVTINNPTLYYQTVQDEGSSLPQQPILNFIGTGVSVSNGEDGKTNVTINDCCNFVELTNSQMLELIANGTVDAGTYYKITDPINADEGVIVQGIVTNANPSLQGSGIFLNADYQNVGDYSGVSGYAGNLGIWSNVTQTVVAGNVVIWGNRHWKNLTGNWGGAFNIYFLDDNWELLSKNTTNGYIREIDFIKYNVYTNLVIYRADKRLNEVEYYFNGFSDSISFFQWGRDLSLGNKIIGTSYMEITNSYCSFLNNYIFHGHLTDTTNSLNGNLGGYEVNFISYGVIEVENNYGQIFKNNISNTSTIICTTNTSLASLNNNTLSNATLLNIVENSTMIQNNTLINDCLVYLGTINNFFNENNLVNFGLTLNNNGFIFRRCNLSYNTAYISLTKSIISKVLSNVFSSFELDLDMSDTSIYDIGTQTLTIPTNESHNGIFNLYNSSGYTISKILDSASNHKNTYKPADGTNIIFQHTLIASASYGDLVCDAPSSANNLIGRNYGCDFIEYQFDGELNIRTNLVKLA